MASIKHWVKWILLTAISVAFLIFSVANREAITLRFSPLPYSVEMPEFLFTIACFIWGALTGGIIASLGAWKTKRKYSAAQQRIMALENELKAQHMQQENMPAIPRKI